MVWLISQIRASIWQLCLIEQYFLAVRDFLDVISPYLPYTKRSSTRMRRSMILELREMQACEVLHSTGRTDFDRAEFDRTAEFWAIHVSSSFTMSGSSFAEVPDFRQAHFVEPPSLDNMTIKRSGCWARLKKRISLGMKPPFIKLWTIAESSEHGQFPARYRVLKMLALQGHDHIREQEYFAEELLALRGNPDKLLPDPRNWFRADADGQRKPIWPGGGRYWLGLLYQSLSNFGRSALRPLFWWVTSSACLYGIQSGGTGKLPDRFIPVIPDLVYFVGIAQTLFSLVLIFLFLLALRNHFRIR